MVMGTVGYMSPEQVRGKIADHRSDIFAFGAILYEMVTGKQSFRKSTSADTMAAILNEEPPSISQIAPTCASRITARRPSLPGERARNSAFNRPPTWPSRWTHCPTQPLLLPPAVTRQQEQAGLGGKSCSPE